MKFKLPILMLMLILLAACQDKNKPAEPVAPVSDQPPVTTGSIKVKNEPVGKKDVKLDEGKPDYPTLNVQTTQGDEFDLEKQRGQWVVVNFWATWCSPCLEEMPELSALDAMRENIKVVGLAYEEIDLQDMKAFLQKHPVVYPVAIVDVTAPPADFATPRGLPMTYLIAPDGKVARKFLGPVKAADIEVAIKEVEQQAS